MNYAIITDEARRRAHAAAVERWVNGSADTTQMLLSVDAALVAAAPLIAEDARDRLVEAAARAVNREGEHS